jgi:hypothetical protein
MKTGKVRPVGADWLLSEIVMSNDGDVWGTAMEWLFAVCHVLWHHTAEEIPAEWDYHHPDVAPEFCAPSADGRSDLHAERTIMERWPSLSVDNPDRGPAVTLLYVGRVLDRYATWCRLAGRDY